MRQKLSILLFLALMHSAALAQIIITTPYEFSAGLSSGITLSSVSFNPKVPRKNVQGFTFGVTGRMTMGENVGLQAELNYVGQGWKEFYEAQPEYKYARKINYLQFPFYTHIQFGSKTFKGFLNAGPQLGYAISESSSPNLSGIQPPFSTKQHDMPVEKNFEWGLSGGVGLEFRTGLGYFLVEGRYFYAFSDIYSTKRKDYFGKASSQVITIKASYLIPF